MRASTGSNECYFMALRVQGYLYACTKPRFPTASAAYVDKVL